MENAKSPNDNFFLDIEKRENVPLMVPTMISISLLLCS